MSGTIILTSTGFSNPKIMGKFVEVVGDIKKANVAIITTAAEDKAKNKFSVLAKNQLLDAGFNKIDFVDLENDATDFSKYSIIYVTGGNTFKLLKFAREKDFGTNINNLLSQDGIYIGVSAGSLIMCPTIDLANEINPDPNEVGLTDLSAFHFVDYDIYPHYDTDIEQEISEYEKRHNNEVRRLKNGDAIILRDGKSENIVN